MARVAGWRLCDPRQTVQTEEAARATGSQVAVGVGHTGVAAAAAVSDDLSVAALTAVAAEAGRWADGDVAAGTPAPPLPITPERPPAPPSPPWPPPL